MDKETIKKVRNCLLEAQERLIAEVERCPQMQKYSDVKLINNLGECIEILNAPADEETASEGSVETKASYAMTVVSSEGYDDGTESRLFVFSSFKNLVNEMHKVYKKLWEELEEDGQLSLEGSDEGPEEEMLDSNGNSCLTKEEFEKHLLECGYILIQLDDRHYQFEYKGKTVVEVL